MGAVDDSDRCKLKPGMAVAWSQSLRTIKLTALARLRVLVAAWLKLLSGCTVNSLKISGDRKAQRVELGH
jgi:hypothetical protein